MSRIYRYFPTLVSPPRQPPPPPETVTLDKYYQQRYNPTLRKATLSAAIVAGSFFFGDAIIPSAAAAQKADWHQPIRQPYFPSRRLPLSIQAGSFFFVDPFSPSAEASGKRDWPQPISQPHFPARRLPPSIQSGSLFIGDQRGAEFSIAKQAHWHQPIRQPYFSARRLPPSIQSGSFVTGLRTLYDFKWMHGGPALMTGDIVWARRMDFDKNNNQFIHYEVFGHITGRDQEGQNYVEIVSGSEYLGLFGKGLQFARIGSLTDPQRRGYILISAGGPGSPRIDIADGVDSIAKFGTVDTLLARLGKLDIVDSNFGDLTGKTGVFLKGNAYIKGTLAGGSASALMTGAGYWFDPGGSGRLGNPATNKYLRFDVGTGVFEFGSAVTLQWAQVTGSGKPQDDATFGADWNSNVTGRPTNLVALGDVPGYIKSTFIDSTEVRAPNITGNSILGGNIVASSGGTNTVGLTGEGSGDTAVRIWAGSTYANRANATFRVTQGGSLITRDITIETPNGEISMAPRGLWFLSTDSPPTRLKLEANIIIGEHGNPPIEVWNITVATGVATGLSVDKLLGQSVSFGANDSAGTGYRVVRVPNV